MPSSPVVPAIEFAAGFAPRPLADHVVFDFDGTLSLLRGGWAEVMCGMFLELMPAVAGDDPARLRCQLMDDIMALNGQPTIQQMKRFRERVLERGAPAWDAGRYYGEFRSRLSERSNARIAEITGGAERDRHLVRGSRAMLTAVAARGFTLHLVSGTVEREVRAEAALLGIDHFFGERIHGPQDDQARFSKRAEIDRILTDYHLSGERLLAFGDGVAEIQETKRVGGCAVAVASDESGGGGIDAGKRSLLLEVGADAVIADYRDGPLVIDRLCGGASKHP